MRRPAAHGATPAVLLALTAIGAALRVGVARDSLFGDELATWWLVSTRGLGSLVSTLASEVEITPPLSFVASWLTTRVALTPELLRAPSLVCGVAAIPLTWQLGRRTLGGGAGLLAAALVALSPFMVFYSAEARAYAPMLVLVLGSTLAMLAGVDDGRARWWVAYGACTCAALYAHYTAAFVLGPQLAWLLWAHPQARRAALLANLGAACALAPWLPGLLADLRSPDTETISVLSPFTPFSARVAVTHWLAGYPYVTARTELRDLPGPGGLALLVLAVVAAGAGIAGRVRRGGVPRGRWSRDSRTTWEERPEGREGVDRRLVLVGVLALAAPVGAALASAVGPSVFATRNLAASWPGFATALAALLLAAGPRLRVAAVALALGGYAIAAGRLLDVQRPDYRAAAAFVDRAAAPGDVVVDGAAFLATPGPLTGLDAALTRRRPIVRAGVPQQRDHVFRLGDPVLRLDAVARRAGARRVVVVCAEPAAAPGCARLWDRVLARRRVQARSYPGFTDLAVLVYAAR